MVEVHAYIPRETVISPWEPDYNHEKKYVARTIVVDL